MPLVQKLKALFPQHLHRHLYMVGGMVRDLLLGVESQDIDLVAAIPPEALLPLGFQLVQSTSTPDIFFLYRKDLGKVELTALPDEDALHDDLRRRDFTVNAIAQSLDGQIVDPLGGRSDLEQRLLKLCSPKSLTDDPARIFRAFRFECDGWQLGADVEAAVAEREWSADLSAIPVERFSQEMLKSLGKQRAPLFFQRILQSKTCSPFLPELLRMPQVPAGPLQHHPEGDLFTHSIQVMEKIARATTDPAARFCGMFHDLGKLSTEPELYPKHHGHEAAGALVAREMCRRLRLPSALQRALETVCTAHGIGNRWGELRSATKVRLALDAVKGGVSQILPLVVSADAGVVMDGWEEALQVTALSTVELGLEPGYFERAEVPPEKRQEIVMQRRIEAFRRAVRKDVE